MPDEDQGSDERSTRPFNMRLSSRSVVLGEGTTVSVGTLSSIGARLDVARGSVILGRWH